MASGAGRPKTVSVEVRKKRTYVNRTLVTTPEESQPVAEEAEVIEAVAQIKLLNQNTSSCCSRH